MSTFARSSVSLAAATVTAVTLGLASASAFAVDFDGYFRAGPGATSKNAARACYNLAGMSGGHYRLGNECDFYGEFGLAQTGTVGGVSYKAKVMINEWNGGTDIGGSGNSFEQMYVEGKGFDVSPDTNFWIGKRFYGRADVHILDQKFVVMDGVGAGADNIAFAGGKLGLAYFGTDGGANGTSTNPGQRLNADLTDLPVNAGGKLRVTGTYTKGNYDTSVASNTSNGNSGFGLSLQHNQAMESIGGGNTLWLQYASGSAGLDGNFGNMAEDSSVKKMRIVDSVNWQVGAFGGQAVALYGRHDASGGLDSFGTPIPKYTEKSIGGRISYALTNNLKLLAELGHMEKSPDGSPTQKLTKFTIGPALSTGPGFWTRPELRLYVTTAKWNDAANAATAFNTNGVTTVPGLTGLNNGKTSGTSIGAQVEMWF